MKIRCIPCRRDFKSEVALQQHKLNATAHKFNCKTCDRQFRSEETLTEHYQNDALHTQVLHHSTGLVLPIENKKPNRGRDSTGPPKPTKPRKPPKPLEKWSMYPSLHDDVSNLLHEDHLFFTFHRKDDSDKCIDTYDTVIMGQFKCTNPKCRLVWTSGRVPITIRRYSKQRYNARVYHQCCQRCRLVSIPKLDSSYAERVAYRLKKWPGVWVEPPPFSEKETRPHRSDLCEGCKAGHCMQKKMYPIVAY